MREEIWFGALFEAPQETSSLEGEAVLLREARLRKGVLPEGKP